MRLHSCRYTGSTGWLPALPTEMDSPQTLVLAFGARVLGDQTAPFDELRAAFPHAQLLGCSTSGEMAGTNVDDASISLVVARFEHTRLRLATTEIVAPADSRAAGERLASQISGPGLRAVFLLSDGLNVNGTSLVSGLTSRLPPGVTITGGLAGDGSDFRHTWVISEGRPQPHRIAAVGLYGERLRVSSGCNGGWLDFGPQRRITRSEGNVLFELDGKPALDLYKEYLGSLAAGLPGSALLFPLAIRRPDSDGKPVVRTILAIDEQQHSLTFAGDVPEGFEARLMRTTDEGLIDSAAAAVAQACGAMPSTGPAPALVVSVSCVGRRLVLGERTEEEVESISAGAPPGATHVGFYSYGEIAPGLDGGASELHNQTMTVTIFAED